jgi:hypothetical protein
MEMKREASVSQALYLARVSSIVWSTRVVVTEYNSVARFPGWVVGWYTDLRKAATSVGELTSSAPVREAWLGMAKNGGGYHACGPAVGSWAESGWTRRMSLRRMCGMLTGESPRRRCDPPMPSSLGAKQKRSDEY